MESARDDYNCHQGDERVSLYINTNLTAMNAQSNLVNTDNELSSSMQKLSSGLRINSAADDAAGFTISENLQGQVNGVAMAQQNTQDAVSLVQTADGSLSEVEQMLQRIRELAVQYQNGTLNTTDQTAIQTEVNQLASEIERIGTTAQFNGIHLLNSTQTITFQVGANDGEVISVATISLGSSIGSFSLSASTVIASIDAAINAVAGQDDTFGAVQNRLQYTMDNLSTYEENLTAANAAIVDVNMASEMTNFANLQILQQAGTAILAQANHLPQQILTLIQQG
jgi:flagellin